VRSILIATSLTVAISFAASARAQSVPAGQTQAQNVAEQLFVTGKLLMQEKEYDRACPKFEESFRLDPTATGTLLNLALCYEAVGRYASAWSRFREVAARSRGKREDRVKTAEEHAVLAQKQLSMLTLKVDPAANVAGFVLRLDGEAIMSAAWGTAIPVDPGSRVVDAAAPGKVPWRASVEVAATRDRRIVEVTPLRDAPREPPPAPAPAPVVESRPPPVTPTPKVDLAASLAAADAVASARARRTVGFTLAGLGLVGLGAGAFFGALALKKNDEATSQCPGDRCRSQTDADTAKASLDSARTDAAIANLSIALGVAAASGGVLLVLLSRAPAEGIVRVAPGPTALGLGAEARF
jgi:tetratricopeptide (TPR) repeat protein